jgi:type II secretory pathway pseudopilin PulG
MKNQKLLVIIIVVIVLGLGGYLYFSGDVKNLQKNQHQLSLLQQLIKTQFRLMIQQIRLQLCLSKVPRLQHCSKISI